MWARSTRLVKIGGENLTTIRRLRSGDSANRSANIRSIAVPHGSVGVAAGTKLPFVSRAATKSAFATTTDLKKTPSNVWNRFVEIDKTLFP